MKSLAQWAMQSRKSATVAASICLTIPLLFWCGAALLALVVLRQGLENSRLVVAWALLPAVLWLVLGDPIPLITAAGATALATVLRQTVRLDYTLLAASAIGIGIYLLLPMLMPEVLTVVVENAWQLVSQVFEHQPQLLADTRPHIEAMIQGVLAAIYLLVIVLSLLLGRYWQSVLYNPKGFGQEFKQLRLPAGYSLIAVILLLSATTLPPELAGVTPVLTVPMMLAGLALLHKLASAKVGSAWMVPVYVALFIFGPYIYTLLIFLAFLDSLFNFRARIKDTV